MLLCVCVRVCVCVCVCMCAYVYVEGSVQAVVEQLFRIGEPFKLSGHICMGKMIFIWKGSKIRGRISPPSAAYVPKDLS